MIGAIEWGFGSRGICLRIQTINGQCVNNRDNCYIIQVIFLLSQTSVAEGRLLSVNAKWKNQVCIPINTICPQHPG